MPKIGVFSQRLGSGCTKIGLKGYFRKGKNTDQNVLKKNGNLLHFHESTIIVE
jgi:hypothetical protein